MKTVKQILENKPSYFNVVTPNTTVLVALQVMQRENKSYVIVMFEEKFKGVMSERDYARKVILEGKNSTNTQVKEIMVSDIPFVDINDTADKCLATMDSFKVKYLLVLDNRNFRGIITLHDIMKINLEEKISSNSLQLFNDDF